MRKMSQIVDARDSFDALESPHLPYPLAVNTSAPASPAISLFSTTGHNRISSSVSSLVPSLGNSMDSPRNHLTGVKEEELAPRDSLEDQYFQHFEIGGSTTEEPYFPMDLHDSYDLSDATVDILHSPKKRRSDSLSTKGVSRIGSHISTMSTRWKSKRTSGSPERDFFPDDLCSRVNSTASSALASPIVSPISRIDSIPPSPARTIFEERMSDSGARPIDITRANSLSQDDNDTQQATTPLLPPFMGDDSTSAIACRVQSPLQSPSVADVSVTDSPKYVVASESRFAGIPSPPLSSRPSIASMSRPRASTTSRTVSGEVAPFMLSDPNDEWANKLGHANFTIQPEPYEPTRCDMDAFNQLRDDWDIARCNFAKHLVRTGEHYGTTSNIFKLTGEKWEFINRQWRVQYDALMTQLGAIDGVALTLTQSNLHRCEQEVRIPRLHDNDKFPEMGDEDIVGPMTVAPATTLAGPCRTKSLKKRNFFKFFQDLVSRP
ncbi:hypothetical protein N7478_013338 [Penicillium angulare]|uniref:uncharacterized protein n=1 Tax=Penicillium angulare TaxID=116970 RepID=UPI002541C606|nr:uncharacterized protein N7478_013338 [Penicillium angulare]KAJ5257234.1 hypothetical protein N7478_013338 [Penicillium angulare]